MHDLEVINRIRKGDKEAYRAIMQKYSERLYQFLWSRFKWIDAELEDVIQEAFIKAYGDLHRYDEKYEFSTWLYTIAYRLAVNSHRKKKFALLEGEALCEKEGVEELQIKKEESARLWQLARQLPEKEYTALLLCYQEGFDVKNASQIMGIAKPLFHVLLYRAKAKLKKIAEQEVETKDFKKTKPVHFYV